MKSKWIVTIAAAIGFGVVGLPAQAAPLSVGKGLQTVGTSDAQPANYRYGRYRHWRHHRWHGYFYQPRWWHRHHHRHYRNW